MSEEYGRIELIAGMMHRRYWSTEQKLRITEESFEPGETVFFVAGTTRLPRTCSHLVLVIDAFDRETIAWTAVGSAGISGPDM